MPMGAPDDMGTNADTSSNKDYCHYCFQNGNFTDPELTLGEEIAKVAKLAVTQMGIDEIEAKQMAEKIIPTLKRWQKS
jgi:hypothetical protein